jgi:tripartite-type tricarboxylate transporter receptor subunit TctC
MKVGRRVTGMVSVVSLTLAAGAAWAQGFPNKPIRIVTSAIGGGNDITARLLAQWTSGPLGQQVVVENRTSLLAAETVAKAQPDGYTLLFAGSSFTVLPLLQKAYDPVKDFAAVSMIDSSPVVVVIHPAVPIKSIKELIAFAKAKPGVLNYGSGTTGGAQHLPVELFKSMTGTNIVRIPYKGAGPALNDLIGGQIQMMFTTAASASPHLKSGKLTGLAVSSIKPSALAPDLPTLAAAGVPGYEFLIVDAMMAPAKTPAAVVNRLNQELVRALNTSEAKEKFLSFGAESAPSTPAELAAFIKSDTIRLGKLIKDAGIRAD